MHPKDPDAKIKFLAAEALRGVGGLILSADGQRFCDELGRRDYVSGEMYKNKGPFRLVLNSKAGREIEWLYIYIYIYIYYGYVYGCNLGIVSIM